MCQVLLADLFFLGGCYVHKYKHMSNSIASEKNVKQWKTFLSVRTVYCREDPKFWKWEPNNQMMNKPLFWLTQKSKITKNINKKHNQRLLSLCKKNVTNLCLRWIKLQCCKQGHKPIDDIKWAMLIFYFV